VESQKNYLGIYISKTAATIVCLDSQRKGSRLLACFDVSLPQQEADEGGSKMAELARLIAEGCSERQIVISEAYVALDCAMFMQHKIHSDFADVKQINQTVRFDTEEALSTDISSVAVAYKIATSSENGSELDVYTAEHKILSEILLALQGNGIDPVAIEPDVNCLARFIEQNDPPPADKSVLFAFFSEHNGYFIGFARSRKTPTTRAFLIGGTQDRNILLLRQVPLTSAAFGIDGPVEQLRVFDSKGSIDCQRLSEKLGIEVTGIEPGDYIGGESENLSLGKAIVGAAIAGGAVLAPSERQQRVNFRDDYMPYQGRKLRLQKALKIFSASVSVLLIALGMYLTVQLLQVNKYRARILDKLRSDYSAVALGQRMPGRMSDAVKKLGSIKRLVEHNVRGMADDESIPTKLAFILEAFNKCARRTDLNIDSITVTEKYISIKGDTSNHANTLKLFDTIKQRMDIPKVGFNQEGPRHGFNITVVPRKTGAKTKRRS